MLINDVPYVVDCGTSTSQQLLAAGVALNRLRYVFLTHLHSDHMLEYGPLVYNAWVAGLRGRVDAYGPPPLRQVTQAFWEYGSSTSTSGSRTKGGPIPGACLS